MQSKANKNNRAKFTIVNIENRHGTSELFKILKNWRKVYICTDSTFYASLKHIH